MIRPRARSHAASPLSSTELDVTIVDVIAEYVVRHAFRNTGTDPIEAIYSFPIPLDAAFMGMEATLAGEQRLAQILPAREAALTYDDAITDGDSAVLLEQLEPGLLCANLGNLKPGEAGEIVLRFAAPLRISDRTARFSLPFVHRPRYGRSSLDEIVEPGHDFSVEHPMQARIRVTGLLVDASVQCASHPARFSRQNGVLALELGHAMLDRDLVVNFELAADLPATARLVADGDGAIGILSFVLPAQSNSTCPLDLCLLLDGSGSMTGDAIAQSRDALTAVAATLQGDDRIQVLRFGSNTVPMFRRLLGARAKVREALLALRSTVNSDLGGTEIGAALEVAINGLGVTREEERNAAIVLVTDGAVQPQEIESAQLAAEAVGIRVFVVAVGSSAGADVLAPLAEATGGVLERAVPAEPIDVCVMRQFRRARELAPLSITVDWQTPDVEPLPIGVAYPGDAITAIARLARRAPTEAHVHSPKLSQPLHFDLVTLEHVPAWRAFAGQQAYRAATQGDRQSLAMHYGLLTPETSAVLVKVREEGDKVDTLPVVRSVEHMIPEGLVASRAAGSFSACIAQSLRGPRAYADLSVDDHADLSEEWLSASNEEQGRKVEVVPAIEAAAVVKILDQLREALIDVSAAGALASLTLDRLIENLEANDREDARRIVEALGVDSDAVGSAAFLLHLLLQIDDKITLSDDAEAELAMAITAYLDDSGWLSAKAGNLSRVLWQGLPASSISLPL